MGDEAKPAPLEERPQFHRLRHRLERFDVTLRSNHARVLVFYLGTALGYLLHDHIDGLDDVERLEACNHDGLVVVARNKVVGAHADYHADVTGTDESIQAQIRRVEYGLHRGNDVDMVAEDGEVLDAFLFRA